MFTLIKQVYFVLLSFNEFLATRCLSLNDEPCLVTPPIIDMNLVELRYYPFMIKLNKYTGSCNIYLQKYVFQKKQ